MLDFGIAESSFIICLIPLLPVCVCICEFVSKQIGSRQYIVFPGRYIHTQRLKGANVNDKVGFLIIPFVLYFDYLSCLLNYVILMEIRVCMLCLNF